MAYPKHTHAQNDIIYFHDPWHNANGPQRFADIQAFWANIRPYSYGAANAFPAVPPANIRHVRYNCLRNMKATTHFWIMPKFSQISCVAIAVWHMNHIDSAPELISPDRPDILEGSYPTLFAALSFCIFRTLREAEESASADRRRRDESVAGNSPETRSYVQGKFRVIFANPKIRRIVRRMLRSAYDNTPANPEAWIVNRLT